MLRGFVADKFPDHILLHQHTGEEGYIYTYPKVQYKILDGVPMIIGIEEGGDVLREVYPKIKILELGEATYQIVEKQVVEKEIEFGENSSMIQYEFLTPWFALNQKNYKEWQARSKSEKQEKLKRTLVGNILSMAKGLEYVVTEEIKADLDVKPVQTTLKGVSMVGFLGKFSVNFHIPDYLGIGKSVSRGFGTVVQETKHKTQQQFSF
jgi:hypothetical protein